ncbi:hypothetical protein EV361DRAFT_833347 [Lentinula raphanica]|nr:hypothetical protein EV361DRAFT_833347 [Lentinula raphanica]
MTSRVQKGGPIFRPLGRQKSRSTAPSQSVLSRQPNTAAEQDQIVTSLQSPIASSSSQGLGSSSTFLDASQSLPGSVTAATSDSLAPNATRSLSQAPSSLTISRYGTIPALPPSIVPTISPATSISSQPPPRSQSSTVVPPIHRSSGPSIENNRVSRSSPPGDASVQSLAQNIDGQTQPLGEGFANIETSENRQDSSPENDQHKKKARSRRDSTRKTISTDQDDEQDTSNEEGRSIKRRKGNKKPKVNRKDTSEDAQRPRRTRRRKSRSPSLPPFDPSADPGEVIDPNVVTMASLCSDTGRGRVSSNAQEILKNHSTWKASNRERRARMKLMMERKKYGHPEDEDVLPDVSNNSAPAAPPAELRQPEQPLQPHSSSVSTANSTAPTSTANPDPGSFDYTQNLTASRFNVQVRIGPNGETIIDEESLFVDREGDAEDDTNGYTHVIESDRSKFTNSSTYGTKLRGTRWSAEETELFYEALSQYGENYELISYVLPGRDRKSCKNKFKAEDKKNPARINYCLNHSVPVDINTLSRLTGRDFSGPTPEIAISKPTEPIASYPTTQSDGGPVEGVQERERDHNPLSSKSRKRSRSHTTGPPEEGLVVIGDLDSFVDHDGG